jgi:hypothetical protein
MRTLVAPWSVLLLLAVPLCVPGCKRAPVPSPRYEAAARLHANLYVRELDDAYLDPRMAQVEADLKAVEPSSASYADAQELLARIAKGRAAALAASEARQKARAEAERGLQAPAIDTSSLLPAPPPAPEELGSASTTLPPPPDPYGPGASLAEMNQASGGCLLPDNPFREGDKVTGTVYLLAQTEGCKARLPGFVGQAVLVVDGRVYRRVPVAETKTVATPAVAADAGAAAPAPASAPAPAPPESPREPVNPGAPGYAVPVGATPTAPIYPGMPGYFAPPPTASSSPPSGE